MTIKDGNNDVIDNIDISKFVITVTGGTLQGTANMSPVQNKGSGKYEFVVNNTGGKAGNAEYEVVVDGVNIGTVTHTITSP